MSNQNSSINSSEDEVKLFCHNCNANLIRFVIVDNEKEMWLNAVYSFNYRNFTCQSCGKVIENPEINSKIKQTFNLRF